jgi:hypothetical protein
VCGTKIIVVGRNKLAKAVLLAMMLIPRLIAVRNVIIIWTEFFSILRKRFEISIDDRGMDSILI